MMMLAWIVVLAVIAGLVWLYLRDRLPEWRRRAPEHGERRPPGRTGEARRSEADEADEGHPTTTH